MEESIFVEVYVPTVPCFYDMEVSYQISVKEIAEMIQEIMKEEYGISSFIDELPSIYHERLQVILAYDRKFQHVGIGYGDRLIIF